MGIVTSCSMLSVTGGDERRDSRRQGQSVHAPQNREHFRCLAMPPKQLNIICWWQQLK